MPATTMKIFKRVMKWSLWVVAGLLLLVILLMLFLMTPPGKRMVSNFAVSYVQKKINSPFSIRSVEIAWLSEIKVRDLSLKDRENQNILSIQQLDIGYSLAQILQKRIGITHIDLKGVEGQVSRNRNGVFNFDYILNAFSSGNDAKVEDPNTTDSSAGFQIELARVSLDNISFLWDDQYGGQQYKVRVPKLLTEFNRTDINNGIYQVRSLISDSVRCDMELGESIAPPDTSANEPSNINITAGLIRLDHTVFTLKNGTAMQMNSVVNHFGVDQLDFQMAKSHLSAKYLFIKDHETGILMGEKNSTSNKEPATEEKEAAPFTYEVDSITVENNHVAFDDGTKPILKGKVLDYFHLDLQDLNIYGSHAGYDGNGYFGRISNLQVRDKSGMAISELQGDAAYSDSAVIIRGLYLKTSQNTIHGDAALVFYDLSGHEMKPADYRMNIMLKDTRLLVDEAVYFQPDLAENLYFKKLMGKPIALQTTIKGTLGRMGIPELSLVEGKTRILASAEVLNLPDTRNMIIDLRLKEFSSTRAELVALLPTETLSDSMAHYIPETFSLRGTYHGSMKDMTADLHLTSSDGNLAIKGNLKNPTDKYSASYDLEAGIEDIQLGKILADSAMGIIRGSVKVKGRGFDPDTLEANYEINLEEGDYKGYSYHAVHASGNVQHGILEANVQSDDPNLDLTSWTRVGISKKNHSLKTETEIRNIDLHQLGFMEDTLAFRSTIKADILHFDSSKLIGYVDLHQTKINYNQKSLWLDTVHLDSRTVLDTQYLSLKTPYLEASLEGMFRLNQIPKAARVIIDKYVDPLGMDTVFHDTVIAIINADVHLPDSVASFIPGLTSIAPFNLVVALNTMDTTIAVVTQIPKVGLENYELDSLSVAVLTHGGLKGFEQMQYGIRVNHVKSSSFQLEGTGIRGQIIKGVVDGKLKLETKDGDIRYLIPFAFHNEKERPYLQLVNDSLIIDQKVWEVNEENIIYLDPKQLQGSELRLSNGDQVLEISADQNKSDGLPLKVSIKDFDLKNIANILISDSSLAKGLANGTVDINSFSPFYFTTDLAIDSLGLMKANLGNLKANVVQNESGVYNVHTTLIGYGNDLSLDGVYSAQDNGTNIKLDLKSFDLKNAAPLLTSYVGDLKGYLHGNLSLSGSINEPVIRGTLAADSFATTYVMTGTYLQIPKAEWVFDEAGIEFSQLEFTDSAGNKGTLTGSIQTKNYRAFEYDLKLKTDGLTVIGRKQFPNQNIYGPSRVDADLTIKGTERGMDVKGRVKLVDKSEFTYVYIPDVSTKKGEGLVEFFDPLAVPDTTTAKKEKEETFEFKFGADLQLQATPTSTVTLVLDPASGDHLSLKGDARLDFSMHPGTEMTLFGNYLLEGGEYGLTIANIVHKEFEIQKGGTVTWTGDPLKGEMNLSAVYHTRTTAAELVNDLEKIENINRQKLNFDVYINLTNFFLEPGIDFKLDMPESDQPAFDGVIYNRIKQVNTIPGELNKQVMGLLVFNHFIANNPFASLSSGGGNLGVSAFNSAGGMLTQELTDLVGKYIKGVDIDFGLEMQDYVSEGKSGTRTDFKVGLSKSLINDRLSVYVGSTFALEGQNQDVSSLSGLAGDVTAEYKLTSDGRYRLKAYRLTDHSITFQGDLIRTGVSFVVFLEFNKFSNMFGQNKRRKNREKNNQ